MHIEPTSRCTLACPGCARTWFADFSRRPFPKHDLDLDALEKFLDCDSGRAIKHFMLNGNHGDPIYYPNLMGMLQRFRDKRISISTNGSHMKVDFWLELRDNMRTGDVIFFSIDGLEHNNHIYRKNSDWVSTMAGLKIMAKGPARVIWKSIIFAYNQNQLAEMESMARDFGAEFIAEPTGYYGDESLIPKDENLVRVDMIYDKKETHMELDPKCQSDDWNAYITADGYYWPCCWISNYYVLHKTTLWKMREQWNIVDQNLDQAKERIQQWAAIVKDQGAMAPAVCQMHCKKNQSNWQWCSI